MKPSDQQVLVAKLRQRRDQAVETIASLDANSRPVELDQTLQGRLSRMDAISQQQMARAGKVSLTMEVNRIDAALARASAGTFGTCCRCELPIESERLHADPAAPFCIDCLEEVIEERRRQGYLVRS